MVSPQEPQQRDVRKFEETDLSKKVTPRFEQAQLPSTGVPWYKTEIGPRLKPSTRRLYQTYSGIADDEIVAHLHSIVCVVLSFKFQRGCLCLLIQTTSVIERGGLGSIRVLENGCFFFLL